MIKHELCSLQLRSTVNGGIKKKGVMKPSLNEVPQKFTRYWFVHIILQKSFDLIFLMLKKKSQAVKMSV